MSSEEQPVALSEAPEAPRDVTHAPTSPSQPPSAVAVTSRPDGGEVSHLNQPTPMSKSALKRLRKQKEWEDRREDRRLKRREKKQAHKLKVRAERQALIAGGADPRVVYNRDKRAAVLVPMAIVVDCDFEKYMTDKERISLSSQVTRAYSDNRNAKFRAHLWVAGFRGKLEARFNDVLQAQQRSWKGASVFAGDFVACAAAAREQMAATKTVTPEDEDGEAAAAAAAQKTHEQLLIGPLRRSLESPAPWPRDAQDPFPLPGEPEPPLDPAHKDVVYLSSDSPYTLSRLEPGTTYVVGGLVDKNREKGLCYRRARERGIRTARLPIGEYMVMHSRQVLATNHVVDIMLKWLEHEDWGKAFLSVIPKRKGGVLRGDAAAGEVAELAQEGSGEPADDDEADEHVEEEEEEEEGRGGEEVDPAEDGSGQHAKKETPKEGTDTA
ncbi:tRNA m(1)G methyltransferase domain-containing protein [Cordyceps javanica]|uniref:tRNA (guanine(9)-N1)-methyltransferase n=1 Tax=Cordyceps javanica TaxID=43265 RepID=A0A545W648_9HYPO|nr:tRNA m(1)G methyltransferase domain-containing protein [Cordyceps javanica]TQW09454.1 tRNA m(1)G methyltransferase domain-containing protein [Cordyceps javanica]